VDICFPPFCSILGRIIKHLLIDSVLHLALLTVIYSHKYIDLGVPDVCLEYAQWQMPRRVNV
jgi:hypothetical protein